MQKNQLRDNKAFLNYGNIFDTNGMKCFYTLKKSYLISEKYRINCMRS